MAVARSEAVQPSLWDRLIDDLPGIRTEIASLRESLVEHLGDQIDLGELVEGGLSGLRRRTDLDEHGFRLSEALVRSSEAAAKIEALGVVVTPDVLREAVRRDIEMLFNVERLEARYLLTEREEEATDHPAQLLADYPEVRSSVVNFGVPAFAGRKGSDFDRDDLARDVRTVLATFEPRLVGNSIKVDVRYADKAGMRIDIDATLMLSPVPERLRLSTTIDLDNGRATTQIEEA